LPPTAVASLLRHQYLQQVLKLATLRFDATPPVGQGVGFGVSDPTTGLRDPLFMRGFLLDDGTSRFLIVTSDWCGIMNSAHRDLAAAYARGAGVPEDRVVLLSTHQHDAPLIDFEIEELLGVPTFARDWWAGILTMAEETARAASARLSPVADVGHAETRLWGYASNRVVVSRDGTFLGSRWSRTPERELVEAPAGTIDPHLRTLAFRDPAGRLSATISFYASHPQVASGGGRWSADAPGEAMRLLAERTGAAEHALCMGCAGNVTAGKYSHATDREGNLLAFGRRLADGITRNLAAMAWEPAGAMTAASASFPFPAARGRRAALVAEIRDPAVPASRRQVAAPVLSSMDDPHNETYVLRRLRLGSATLLFFPGEPFVEYQLFAQAEEPDRFVACASNCGDSFLYLPRAASFTTGGYEVSSFCWCTEEIEPLLENAIRTVLAP
jgi:hypothetical protein